MAGEIAEFQKQSHKVLEMKVVGKLREFLAISEHNEGAEPLSEDVSDYFGLFRSFLINADLFVIKRMNSHENASVPATVSASKPR